MAITGAISIEELLPSLTSQIAQINLWLKGLGIFVIVWVVYVVVLFVMERERMKRFDEIERKIDKLLAKKKI